MKRFATILLSVVMMISFAGCSEKKDVSADKNNKVTAVNVKVEKVEETSIADTITYTGEVKASETVSVSAKASATAKEVKVEVGDYVKEGDVLLTMDDTDYRLQYDKATNTYNQTLVNCNQAEAAYDQASAIYEQASAGYDQAVSAVSQAESAYNQAKVSHSQAQNAVGQAEASVGQAEAAYKQAEANYQAAVNSYNSVVNGASQQTKLQLKSALDAAKMEYDNAKKNYDDQKVLYNNGAISKSALDAAQTRYDNAKLNYDTANENYNLSIGVILSENEQKAKSGITSAEEAKNSAKAAIDSAKAGVKTAESNVESALVGIDRAAASIDSAKAGVDSAKASMNSAKAGMDSAKAGVDRAKTDVENAKIQVESAQNALDNTVVKAPISGYIAVKNANKGQMVAQGVEIFVIKETRVIDVEINVTEAVVSDLQIGFETGVLVKAVSKEKFKGVITNISPTKDAKTGMYKVTVQIDGINEVLKDGMFADVEITLAQAIDAVVISADALLEDKDGTKYVYIAKGDKAKRVDVVVGIITDTKVEIISGITVGDKVIISGKEYLSKKNTDIKIVK